MNYNSCMKKYETPIFNRPIESEDFKNYINKPRRRRFHDINIWPERYQTFNNIKYKNKMKNIYGDKGDINTFK